MSIDQVANSSESVTQVVGPFIVTSGSYGIHIRRDDGDMRILGVNRTYDPRSPYSGVHHIFGWELPMGVPTEREVRALWDYVGTDKVVQGDPKHLS